MLVEQLGVRVHSSRDKKFQEVHLAVTAALSLSYVVRDPPSELDPRLLRVPDAAEKKQAQEITQRKQSLNARLFGSEAVASN